LAQFGAQPQRLLWDITTLGNTPQTQYYIDSLVGAGTVLALSPLALQRYDQDNPTHSGLVVDVESAHQLLQHLEQFISLGQIADRLLDEEFQRSQCSFDQLLETIRAKHTP
jgi:hypothetical protein